MILGRRFCFVLAIATALGLSAHSAGAQQTWRRFATADGDTLAYTITPQAHRDTVIIPMGSHLEAFAQPLATAKTLVLYDIRGRGRSQSFADPAKLDLATDASDLDELRRALGISRVQLIGWSYGAALVFQYSRLHANRVSRVVLLNPVAPRRRPYTQVQQPIDTAGEQRIGEAMQAGMNRTDPRGFCRLANEVEARSVISDPTARRRRIDLCDLPNEWPEAVMAASFARLSKLGNYDWESAIAGSDLPMLVITGNKDFIPIEASQTWARRGRLEVVQDAGHYAFLEWPEHVRALMLRFLE
jgi:pimeloyl-ACP methyl ester carboxylesterase